MAPMNCLSEERYRHSRYAVVSTSDDAITVEMPRFRSSRIGKYCPRLTRRREQCRAISAVGGRERGWRASPNDFLSQWPMAGVGRVDERVCQGHRIVNHSAEWVFRCTLCSNTVSPAPPRRSRRNDDLDLATACLRGGHAAELVMSLNSERRQSRPCYCRALRKERDRLKHGSETQYSSRAITR
jgi:hypothetical protein